MLKFMSLNKNIKVMFLISFIQKLTGAMIYPFMAIFLSDYYSLKVTGLLILVIAFASMVSNLLGGYYSDAIGRKKTLLISEIIRLITFIFIIMFNSEPFFSPLVIFLLLVINNFALGLGSPINQTVLIDYSDTNNRRYIYTISYWVLNCSVGIGTIIGAFLYERSFNLILFLISISSLINLTFITFILKDKLVLSKIKDEKIQSNNVLKEIITGYFLVLKDSIFTKYLIAVVLVAGLEAQFTNYIAIYLKDVFGNQTIFKMSEITFRANGVEVMGLLRSENTFIIVLLTTFVMSFFKKFNDWKLTKIGLLLFTFGFTIICISNNFWILFLATFIFSIGEIVYGPPSQVMLSKIAEGKSTSKYMALNSLSVRSAGLVGSLGIILGSVFKPWQMAIVFMFMGLASMAIYFFIYKTMDFSNRVEKNMQLDS